MQLLCIFQKFKKPIYVPSFLFSRAHKGLQEKYYEFLLTLCTGTPTLPLCDWITYLEGVTTEWKKFAAYLLPHDSAATEIKIISSKCHGDIEECKMELYNIFDKKGEKTWERVVYALEKSSLFDIAKKIKTDFNL